MPINNKLDRATAPFVIRKEGFGCLLYHRSNHKYSILDNDALDIFTKCSTLSLSDAYAKRENQLLPQINFNNFVRMCQSMGILTNDGSLNAYLMNNKFEPNCKHLSAPLEVWLQVTRYCDLKCTYCWADAGKARPRELSKVEITQILDQMAEMGIFVLHLGGGEPLGRKDLPELIQYANELGISVNISTNALRANAKLCRTLGSLNVNSFQVSIAAGSEKRYDSLRGQDNAFRKVMRGLDNLKTNCPQSEIYFKVVLYKDNQDELPSIVTLANQKQINRVVIDLALPVGRGLQLVDNKNQTLSPQEAVKIVGIAREKARNTPKMEIEVLPEVPNSFIRESAFRGFGCSCGNSVCHITSEGVVSPSGFVSDTKPAGNIRFNTFYDIWNNSQVFKEFRSSSSLSAHSVPQECASCSHYKYCRGGCRSRTLVLSGNLNARDPLCSAVKADNTGGVVCH